MTMWIEIVCKECGTFLVGENYTNNSPANLRKAAKSKRWECIGEDTYICPKCKNETEVTKKEEQVEKPTAKLEPKLTIEDVPSKLTSIHVKDKRYGSGKKIYYLGYLTIDEIRELLSQKKYSKAFCIMIGGYYFNIEEFYSFIEKGVYYWYGDVR